MGCGEGGGDLLYDEVNVHSGSLTEAGGLDWRGGTLNRGRVERELLLGGQRPFLLLSGITVPSSAIRCHEARQIPEPMKLMRDVGSNVPSEIYK